MRRRVLPPLLLLLLCLPLWAGTGVEVHFSDASPDSELEPVVRRAVLKATEEGLLSRMPDDGLILSVLVGPITRSDRYAVAFDLSFSYGTETLTQHLSAKGDDPRSLEKRLYGNLLLQLRYDGLSLVPPADTALSLDYCHRGTCSVLAGSDDRIAEGDLFAVVDKDGNRTALLVCDNLQGKDGRTATLLPLYSGTLLPGMGLERMKGNTVSLALLLSDDDGTGAIGADAAYCRDIGLYPFLLSVRTSLLFRSDHTVAGAALAGLETLLPLSLLFASPDWGDWSLAASCHIGVGRTGDGLLLASDVGLAVRRGLSAAWGVQLGVSKRNWSLSTSGYDGGLSLRLSTTYTW